MSEARETLEAGIRDLEPRGHGRVSGLLCRRSHRLDFGHASRSKRKGRDQAGCATDSKIRP